MERQGADLQTKIEELQEINQSLREKDKMKEDVISNLSDKLMMLSERLDAVEKIELVIRRTDHIYEKQVKEKDILSSLKKGLMQQLLTGKIRVKV